MTRAIAIGIALIALGNGGSAYAQALPRPRLPVAAHFPAGPAVVNENSFYAQVLNHAREKIQYYDDRVTTAHETTHDIHSFLRNYYIKALGRRVNAFYVGDNSAFIVDEPAIKKAQAIEFVPKGLRGGRFHLYMEEQKEWDDEPLYVFDEWVAYVNGGLVAIEEARKKPPEYRSDIIFACAEFAVYATALGMAIDKHDPRYFEKHEPFRNFLAWHLKRSIAVYRIGVAREQFRWKPEYYEAFRSGEEGRPLREFLTGRLGIDLRDIFE